MQIGATFPQTEIECDPIAIRDFAQACEEIGFSFLVFYDHVLGADPDRPGGWTGLYDKDDPFHEPFVTFAYLAALTKRIELMTSILVLPQRQTALVAKQAAEVDLLSGGRLQLGVGNGWNEVEFEALGMSFHDRGRRIEEQIEVLRLLWENDTITYEGTWHRITAAGILPRPKRRIPIWIGGGADAVVRRAARIGDGWAPGGTIHGPVQAREAADNLRRYLEAEGRDPTSFPILGGLLAHSTPTEWVQHAKLWRDVGATHVCIHTMGAGFSRVDQHIDAARRFYEEMAGRL
jgi:probable F420-dependent oxidoreductase